MSPFSVGCRGQNSFLVTFALFRSICRLVLEEGTGASGAPETTVLTIKIKFGLEKNLQKVHSAHQHTLAQLSGPSLVLASSFQSFHHVI